MLIDFSHLIYLIITTLPGDGGGYVEGVGIVMYREGRTTIIDMWDMFIRSYLDVYRGLCFVMMLCTGL